MNLFLAHYRLSIILLFHFNIRIVVFFFYFVLLDYCHFMLTICRNNLLFKSSTYLSVFIFISLLNLSQHFKLLFRLISDWQARLSPDNLVHNCFSFLCRHRIISCKHKLLNPFIICQLIWRLAYLVLFRLRSSHWFRSIWLHAWRPIIVIYCFVHDLGRDMERRIWSNRLRVFWETCHGVVTECEYIVSHLVKNFLNPTFKI